jgi:prophage regulatory protein
MVNGLNPTSSTIRSPIMTPQLLRLPAVKATTGLSRSTIYALIAEGAFPRQVKLTARCVGWRSEEIERWLSSRK